MKNILITGGYGLLGQSLNFGIKPSKQELDVLNYNQLSNFIEKNNISSIIHTAAKVGGVKANLDYMFDFFEQNVQMNINVMNVCKKFNLNNSTFIISTCVFPENASQPLKEEYLHQGEPHFTNYGYAYSKRLLEIGSRALKQQYNISTNCLIPCNLYGENDNYDIIKGHVIPSLIHKCYLAKLNNTNFEIWGSGNAEREFLYVKDFSNIIELIYKNNMKIDGSIIISPDQYVSIKEIVEIIVSIFKFKGKVVFDSTKLEGILRKNTDNSKFKTLFPGFKFIPLQEGLENTIEYFLQNYNIIRK